jgi:catechol 2,3-dioxygenase-like lactoylglutathione lyase family enzyme
MASLDHIGLTVSDLDAAKAFYRAALKPLGISVLMEFPGAAGLGADGKPFFWLAGGGKTTPRVHLAFTAASRAEVDAFHKAAIAAGAKDNGPPGIRADYHPNYYGAFVLDADGHNVEAVCHKPEQAEAKR